MGVWVIMVCRLVADSAWPVFVLALETWQKLACDKQLVTQSGALCSVSFLWHIDTNVSQQMFILEHDQTKLAFVQAVGAVPELCPVEIYRECTGYLLCVLDLSIK